jgi:tetratricopeptide (TPR) repeat protein
MHSPSLDYSYERALLTTPEQIAAFYVASGPALRQLAVGGVLNTDDRPFVEYQAPRDMIEVGGLYGSHHPGIAKLFAHPVVPPPGNPLADWPREAVLEWRARRRLADASDDVAGTVLAELRDAGLAALAAKLADERARVRSAASASDPLGEARALLARGDVTGAAEVARTVLASATGAARLEPLLMLGIVEFGLQQSERALTRFSEAQSLAPEDGRAYLYEARLRLNASDPTGARQALERGIAHLPGDPELVQALRSLAEPQAR